MRVIFYFFLKKPKMFAYTYVRIYIEREKKLKTRVVRQLLCVIKSKCICVETKEKYNSRRVKRVYSLPVST